MENILIITTDAHRTGTPTLLLRTFEYIKLNSDHKLIFIFQEGGELIPEFEKLGNVHIWNEIVDYKINKRFDKIYKSVLLKLGLLSKQILVQKFLDTLQKDCEVKLIYNNTSRNGHILKLLKQSKLNCRVITQVHEPEKFLSIWDKDGLVSYTFEHTDSFITVSNYVKDVLIQKYNIKKQIEVIPGAVDTRLLIDKSKHELKRELGLSENTFILLSCGWMGWHKGVDFFIQLARKLKMEQKDVYMIWLGGEESDITFQQLEFDIEKLNLNESVRLITNKKNVQDYFNLCDLFLMLSREESFSLVTAEAGFASKPVLCFEKSGGPCEITGGDTRFLIPYGDVDRLFDRILALVEDERQRIEMGSFLHNRVVANYTIENVANKVLNAIKSQF